MQSLKVNYIPTLRLGVCVTRDPAPMPECLGVPGTITFACDPEVVLTANASSAACLAVLCTVYKLANDDMAEEPDVRFPLFRYFCLEFSSFRELLVSLPS
jgi:hypothetical protein